MAEVKKENWFKRTWGKTCKYFRELRSELKKVVWSTSPIANPLTHDNRADYDKNSGTYTIQLLKEDSGFPTTETTYYIYAVDESDQIKSITTTVKFDSVAPKVESINIAEEDYIIYEGQCYVSKSEIGVELVAGDVFPDTPHIR